VSDPPTSSGAFAVHGHFYQPPREDPFTGVTLPDPSASPSRDWTSRVAAESYAPNAAHGNFRRIGWDLGPTLARWLRRERPDLHDAIVGQDDGCNGMAQGYHHAILPYASVRDRRTEVRWGLRDFELRVGRRPTGLWLPETAVDRLTLRIAAEEGVRWTILAPWQSETETDTGVAYAVELGGGYRMGVAIYDAELSAAVSFDPHATSDADRFLDLRVRPRLTAGELVMIATDGELYGHHQPFREMFLQRLLDAGATDRGIPITSPGRWFDGGTRLAPLPTVRVRDRSSWSCHHGVARWGADCPCVRDGRWKAPLRAAFDRLAAAIDVWTELGGSAMGLDPWAARDRYADVASDFVDADAWAARELEHAGLATDAAARHGLVQLMSAQASRLAMFASCGWYWEEPFRPETLQALRYAAHAARLIDAAFSAHLEDALVADLVGVVAPGGEIDGKQLYARALREIGQEV
jgi:hypothetical protein